MVALPGTLLQGGLRNHHFPFLPLDLAGKDASPLLRRRRPLLEQLAVTHQGLPIRLPRCVGVPVRRRQLREAGLGDDQIRFLAFDLAREGVDASPRRRRAAARSCECWRRRPSRRRCCRAPVPPSRLLRPAPMAPPSARQPTSSVAKPGPPAGRRRAGGVASRSSAPRAAGARESHAVGPTTPAPPARAARRPRQRQAGSTTPGRRVVIPPDPFTNV